MSATLTRAQLQSAIVRAEAAEIEEAQRVQARRDELEALAALVGAIAIAVGGGMEIEDVGVALVSVQSRLRRLLAVDLGEVGT